MNRRAQGLRPGDHRHVQRFFVRIGPELDEKAEYCLSGFQALGQVGAEIRRISWLRFGCWELDRGLELVLDEPVRTESERQAAPIGTGQHAANGLGHVAQDSRRFLVRGEIGIITPADHARLGELAHILRSIDEEDVHVLEDEVEGGVSRRAKNLLTAHPEKFDADAECGGVVAECRQRVRREAHPGRVFSSAEDPDFQVVGQVRHHTEDPVRDAMRFEEHRSKRWTLARADSAGLHHADEHLGEGRNRIGGAIQALAVPSSAGCLQPMCHSFPPGQCSSDPQRQEVIGPSRPHEAICC